jgi:hypothetical protein
MVARVVQEWSRVDVLVANAGGGRGRPMDTKASSLDHPTLLQLVTENELFGTVYSCNAVAPVMKQQRSRRIIGCRDRTLRRWRLCPLRGCKGSYRSLHAVFGAGSRAFRHHGSDHDDGYSGQHPKQS